MLAVNSPDTATVADLTHGAGFSHLGRTAGRYRAQFGESPSETLKRGACGRSFNSELEGFVV